ncbi:MAG: hypothetical protein ACXWNC_03170, partial [Anaerolineales bacterium]
QSNRVSVWLRTEGGPDYIHLLKPQVIFLNSGTARVLSYSEIYVPSAQIIGFHLIPPAHDPLDYDESETNRKMQPVTVLVGTFVFNGAIRISTVVDLGTSISSGRAVWMSIYDVKISNPQLTQFGEIQVPMLVVRPGLVDFALNG